MAEPRKEVKGLLANGVSQLDVPLCLCANKQDEMSPPANLGGLQDQCLPWKGSVASWWEHMELSDQSAPWQDR